jgi:hypothetical protein
MGDLYLSRRQLLLVKVETTEGTDAAPQEANSGDAIKLVDPWTIDLGQDFIEVVGGNLSRGNAAPITGARPAGITFRSVLSGVSVGSFTAANKPPLHAAIRACGAFETFTASHYDYAPATTAGSDISVTIVAHIDGYEHRMVNCRGNMNLIYGANAPVIAEFTMRGQLTTEASTARSSPTGLTTLAPPKWIDSGSILVDSAPCLNVEALNFNTNNTIYEEKSSCASSGSGINRIILTERAPGGSMDPAATDPTTHNAFGLWRSGSPATVNLNTGTDVGNIVSLTMSNVYYKTVGWGDKTGVGIWNIDYEAYEGTNADDNFLLSYK